MADFEIPHDIDELMSSSQDDNIYRVKNVYKLTEIPQRLDAAKQSLNSDIGDIRKHFDTYFSVLKHGEKNDPVTLKRVSVLLSLLTERLITILDVEVFKRTSLNSNDREKYLTATKMYFYLDYEFLKLANSIQANRVNTFINKGDSKGHWDETRLRLLRQFYTFLKFPISKLFEKNITDNSFIDMFTDTCYRILAASTTPNMAKDLEEIIFHILGQSFKKHLHTASYQSQILNILSQNENAIGPIVNGIIMMFLDYDLKTILSTLIPEFVNMLNIQSKNAILTKNFASFAVEMAHKAPAILIGVMDQLQQNMLNMDPYCLRTAVLDVMSCVIVDPNVEMSEKLKLEMLNDLLESVGDGNSYVRSKVFQLLFNINEKTHFITQNLIKVLTLAEIHLEDKSALVRKNALLLIVELIRSNKSEKKLSIPVLEAELKVENEKFENIMYVLYGLNTGLTELETYLQQNLKAILKDMANENDDEDDGGEEDVERTERNNIVKGIFEESTMLAERLKEVMLREYSIKNYRILVDIVHHVFMRNGDKEEIDKMLPEEREVLYKVKCLNIMLTACTPPEMQTEIDTIQEHKSEIETAIKYVSIIGVCVDKTKRMLFSTTNSDVLSAIEFFKTGYVFSMTVVEAGLRDMLTLFGKADANITQIVTQAFIEVLFRNKPQESSEKYYLETCRNMFRLLNDITVGEILAFEMLIEELMRTEIDRDLITMLFRIFTKKIENISDNESRMALELLRMIAKCRPIVMEDNMELFQGVLTATTDPRVYATCMEILRHICTIRGRFMHNSDQSELVKTVLHTFKRQFFRHNLIAFDKVAKHVCALLYAIVEYPDKVAEGLVLDIYATMMDIAAKIKNINADKPLVGGASQPPVDNNASSVLMELPVWLITRFVHIVGVTSMEQVMFLDTAVFNKLKVDEQKRRLRMQDGNDDDDSSFGGARHRHRKSKAADNDEDTAEKQKIEDEVGESITNVCDLELLYHDNAFLARIVPLILYICKRRDTDDRHKQLRSAAILTLTNLMCVSIKFCEENFMLAIKILESVEDPDVKINIIIGFSDWIFQFPNVSEPWTKFIYNMLKSENDSVRLTTVTILTYLIRQEMVRVRAQISDLAFCLVDREERIKETTRQFFTELSEKPQTLESIMPEIISQLNDESQHLPQFQYEEIMTRLFSLITKEKGTLVMVEKLCTRLKESRTETVAQKCSHCLTLMTHTEKSVRRLIDHLRDMKGKVQIPEVYGAFNQIIAKTNKAPNANGMKAVLDELAAKVEEYLKINDDEGGEEGAPRPALSQASQNKTAARKVVKGGKSKGRKPRRSYSDESDTENSQPPAPTQRTRQRQGVRH